MRMLKKLVKKAKYAGLILLGGATIYFTAPDMIPDMIYAVRHSAETTHHQYYERTRCAEMYKAVHETEADKLIELFITSDIVPEHLYRNDSSTLNEFSIKIGPYDCKTWKSTNNTVVDSHDFIINMDEYTTKFLLTGHINHYNIGAYPYRSYHIYAEDAVSRCVLRARESFLSSLENKRDNNAKKFSKEEESNAARHILFAKDASKTGAETHNIVINFFENLGF